MTEFEIVQHYKRNGLPFGIRQRQKEINVLSQLSVLEKSKVVELLRQHFSEDDLPKTKE